MLNQTSNITYSRLKSPVENSQDTLLPLVLVILFPVVVVGCLYVCIFRMDRNREQ